MADAFGPLDLYLLAVETTRRALERLNEADSANHPPNRSGERHKLLWLMMATRLTAGLPGISPRSSAGGTDVLNTWFEKELQSILKQSK